MSKNITFFILALTSAILTYFLFPLLPAVVELMDSAKLPNEFINLLQHSNLVGFSGYLSLFGLVFILLYLVFPVAYVWHNMNSALGIITDLPKANNPIRRTDKAMFLSRLKDMGFISNLVDYYSIYLIQGADQEVKEEALKNLRIRTGALKKEDDSKITISPVFASAPAEVIFNYNSLVGENLLLGFFTIFSRFLVGAGIISLGFSVVSYSMTVETQEVTLFSALQPGLIALLLCVISAVLISLITHLVDMILGQKTKSVAHLINGLFLQNEWQNDLGRAVTKLEDNYLSVQLKEALNKCLDKPMEEIVRAVKSLSEQQEKKLDNILSKSLENFASNMDKKMGTDATNLNKTLKSAAEAAEQMNKHYSEVTVQYSEKLDAQAGAIAKHLADMQKILKSSERTTQKGTEKIVSSLSTEVMKSQKEFAKFMEESLRKLEEKQNAIEAAEYNKDSILKNLHNTAKDLGTISNASAKLLEKFKSLSSGMDIILSNIQEKGLNRSNGSEEKRDKLKATLMDLKKANLEKTGELPDM